MNIMIAPVVIFLAVNVVLSVTLKVTKPGEFKELPKASANISDLLKDPKVSPTLILPIMADIICAECDRKKDTKEQQKCRNQFCNPVSPSKATTFGKAARTKATSIDTPAPTITTEEEAVHNYVNAILPDKGNSDPDIVISILRDTLCKLCNEIQSTNERKECKLKYCSFTKPSGISVNLGTEKLAPIL